jgi:hypothetical protein
MYGGPNPAKPWRKLNLDVLNGREGINKSVKKKKLPNSARLLLSTTPFTELIHSLYQFKGFIAKFGGSFHNLVPCLRVL